jgi:hypothetical protein
VIEAEEEEGHHQIQPVFRSLKTKKNEIELADVPEIHRIERKTSDED